MNKRRTSMIAGYAATLALTAVVATTGSAGSAAADTTLAAPVDVRVTEVGWQQVTVEWEHGSSETPTMYRIDNLTTGDVWTAYGSDTSAQVKGLEPEQTYRLQIKAVDFETSRSSAPVEVTPTTIAMPHVDPPGDLRVASVEWNGVDLAWEPSPDPELYRYEIVDLHRDRIIEVVDASRTTARLELRPEQTYRFAVQAARTPIEGQQVHSEPTNEVMVTTPDQTIEAPKNLQADLDGRSVTLTWQRPDELDFPTAEVEYLVFDGGVLETIVTARSDVTLEQIIPRVSGGEHEFMVRTRYRFSGLHGDVVSRPSNPAVVTSPLSDDVTAPNPPDRLRHIVDCNTGEETYELEGASDDVSPLAGIQYQVMRFDLRTDVFYVLPDRYDVPRTGPLQLLFAGPDHRFRIRAVDEAGNRSAIAELRLGEEEFVNC